MMMTSAMIAATVACVIACAALMIGEARHARALRMIAKPIASLAFVIAGVIAWRALPSGAAAAPARFTLLIVIGQICGAVGDVALLGRGSAAFLAGLGAFLVGHLAYVIGIVAVLGAPAGAAWALLALPAIAAAIALRWLWPHLARQRPMIGPVIAYVATIATMVGVALVAATGDALPACSRALLVIAALTFFVSDLAVARDRFVVATVANRMWGLPAYYAAQLVFAWSLAAAATS